MNLQELVVALENRDYKVSNDKVNQTQRNQTKAEFMTALAITLAEQGIDLVETDEGLVLHIENKDIDLFIQIDASIKNLDFDLTEAVAEHEATLTARKEKAEALAEAKAKREAEKSKKSK